MFSASPSIKTQPKRSTSDDSKTALRDPAAVRAHTLAFCVSGWHRCVRRSANARKYRDYSGDHKNRKYAAVSSCFVAGGPGFEPRLTESESAVLPLNYPPTAPRKKGSSAEPWPYFLMVGRFPRQDNAGSMAQPRGIG